MARDTKQMLTGLRGYLGVGERLTEVVPLSTGHSNETYLLEGIDRVLRMPPSEEGLLPPYDMGFQHAVLDALKNHAGPALPVPQVHELCEDDTVIGDAFFVMEKLDADAFEFEVPDWLQAGGDPMAGDMCRQWMQAITALHNMPVEHMPGPHKSVADEIAHWRDLAYKADCSPPELLQMLDDLHANPPARSGDPTPVHGDTKIGNCLWHKDRLLAVVDWEMAGVGEPLTDIGYLCQFYDQDGLGFANAGFDLPGWWSREQMVDAWQTATGRTAVDLPKYEVLAICKVTAIIAYGYHLFQTGRIQDPRFEGWGAVVPIYVKTAQKRLD